MKNALQPGVTPHLAEDKHKQMYVILKNDDDGPCHFYQRTMLTREQAPAATSLIYSQTILITNFKYFV